MLTSALIMVVLAFATVTLAYLTISGQISLLTSAKPADKIIVDSVSVRGDKLLLWVRNLGERQAKIVAVYAVNSTGHIHTGGG